MVAKRLSRLEHLSTLLLVGILPRAAVGSLALMDQSYMSVADVSCAVATSAEVDGTLMWKKRLLEARMGRHVILEAEESAVDLVAPLLDAAIVLIAIHFRFCDI